MTLSESLATSRRISTQTRNRPANGATCRNRARTGGLVAAMRRLLLLTLLAAALIAPATATASSSQVMTFEAPGALLDESQREATLDEI